MNPGRIAYDDQYRAAVADLHRRMDRSAAQSGTTVTETDASWIRERFRRLGRTLLAGKGTFCPHIGRSPMVAHTAAWATDQLVCTDCLGTLQPAEGENRCCDRCGRPGPPLHAGSAAHGPVLMAYRLCTACTRAAI